MGMRFAEVCSVSAIFDNSYYVIDQLKKRIYNRRETGESNNYESEIKEMKKIKKLLLFSAAIGLFVFAAGCGAKKEETSNTETQKQTEKQTQKEETGEQPSTESQEGPQVEIKVKDYGTIKLVLDEDNAPITVDNFIKLVEDGFYDGLTFHRIIDGFMIQGGDPLGNGTGGSDETIKGEFSANGVENKISHKRGVISMARSNDMNSASSQFFIVQTDSTYLDGQYAGFGYVTEGMDVVDKICEEVTVQDQNGTVKKEDQPVIESIKMMD